MTCWWQQHEIEALEAQQGGPEALAGPSRSLCLPADVQQQPAQYHNNIRSEPMHGTAVTSTVAWTVAYLTDPAADVGLAWNGILG